MKPLRNKTPKRTYTKKYAKYRSYKKYLREDFNKRCGYCNDLDVICNGIKGFHIDHFRPVTPFKHLETEYSNLVYCCPYCNGAKSNDWPSGVETVSVIDSKGYVDPCDNSFESHFERHDDGRIRAKTPLGEYMFKKLKFGLRRHQLAWTLETLGSLLDEVLVMIDKNQYRPAAKEKLLNHLPLLIKEFRKHQILFEDTL